MIEAINPEIFSALIGGLSGIACAILTARMTNKAHVKQRERDKSENAAYLTSQIAPALRDYADTCLAVSYDDGYLEGQPAGKNGIAEITIKSPTFIASEFSVDWKSLPSHLMIEVLTFQEHTREEASVLNDFHGYYDPPDCTQFFLDRQHIYAQLGIQALTLAERLYEYTKITRNKRGSELREQLSSRLNEVKTQRNIREKHIAQYRPSPDEI